MTFMPTNEPFDPSSLAGIGFGMSIPSQPGAGMVPSFPEFQYRPVTGAPAGGAGFFGGLRSGGFGFNPQTLDLALGGINTLGSIWAAYNAAKVAKQQLKFSRNIGNANLANQTQSYNTALADRARARGMVEGQSQAVVDDYIARNSLQKRTV